MLCIVVNGQGSVLNGIDTASGMTGALTLDGMAFGGFTVIALNLRGGSGTGWWARRLAGNLATSPCCPARSACRWDPVR